MDENTGKIVYFVNGRTKCPDSESEVNVIRCMKCKYYLGQALLCSIKNARCGFVLQEHDSDGK